MSEILRNQEIAAIDKLSASVLEGIDTTFICAAMKGHVSDVFLKQTLDNWCNGKGNFFNFYCYTSKAAQESILKALGIDSAYDAVSEYVSFCQNSTPVVLKDISASAWKTIEEYKIDEYGDDKSWASFWVNTSKESKNDLLDNIHQLCKEYKETKELTF